jgi:CRISPR/Cas system-associated exonuclease Cas4 (RecB family)
MKTTMTLLTVLFAVSSLMAQSGPGQTSSANKRRSKTSEITVQGCLGTQKDDYVLMQTDPGNTYALEVSHKIKLGPHLGEQVEVTGWERPSLSTSSDTFVPNRGVSSVTIVVESVRMLAKRCSAGEVNAGQEATTVSGAQLQVSSVPADADIEIDGNFVGNTPSTVGVAAGQHQLVVKKNHYKPWEKKITVTSGQIRVNPVLESESK